MPSSKSQAFWKRDSSIAVGLFLFLLVLNAFLVSPFIGWYDSGEMLGVTACLGISHPSGQGLYHLFGKLFLLLPFGSPAYRLALFSCACSALTSVLFWILACCLVRKVQGPKEELSLRLKSWLLLLTLAWSLSFPWWRSALIIEVYALHLLLAFLILWALSLERPSRWPLVFLLLGISTVFRPTHCLALPLAGLLFLWGWASTSKKSLKAFFWIFLAFVLGRSTLFYLPLRSALHPELAYADLTHFLPVLKHVFALGYSHFLGKVTAASFLSILQQMGSRFWSELTPFGAVLSIFGFFFLVRYKQVVPPFLWVGLGWAGLEAALILTIPYPAFESHQMLLSWAVLGLPAALPLAFLARWSKEDMGRSISVGLILAVFVLAQFSPVGDRWRQKRERGAQDYARDVLTIMEPGSLYIPAEENEYFPVVGYQQAYGFKKDVAIVEPGTALEKFGPKAVECLKQGRSLYLTREWQGFPAGWNFTPVGPLLRVTGEKAWSVLGPNRGTEVLASWRGLELAGVSFNPPAAHAGGLVEIYYDWAKSVPVPVEPEEWVTGIFSDEKGDYLLRDGVMWLHDIHPLFGGGFSFSAMKPGVLYREKRVLFIPSDYPPGEYSLMVGLQKSGPPPAKQKPPVVEFYADNLRQDVGKFSGRARYESILHFAAVTAGQGAFRPLTLSQEASRTSFFAPAGKLRITPPDETNQ